jgi:hypothetical protein
MTAVTALPRRRPPPTLRFAAVAVSLVAWALAGTARPAAACGCFTPPDVATPLVQAGEKLFFVVDNGKITMHVQLKYSGRAGDFGWLLPLPAIPINSQGMQGIDVGVDELFAQLEQRTQPTYILNTYGCQSGRSGCAFPVFGAASAADGAVPVALPPMSPLIKQGTVGPYDFAILKADDKSQMLTWLNTNKYVVPVGSDQALGPYIRTGGFFLALRLKAGATAGDLQPVVLSYPSDLAQIPIILSSVAATPNMGILVWILGSARAIPRNYNHTVISDASLDWLHEVKNYSAVVTAAVGEAPARHSFVTEFVGDSSLMSGVLNTVGRFDLLQQAKLTRDPVSFVKLLQPQTVSEPPMGPYGQSRAHISSGFAWNGQLFSLLASYIPLPAQLVREGVTPDDYYQRIDFYLGTDRAARPLAYQDIAAQLAAFDPAAAVAELTTRIVNPTLLVGDVFINRGLPKLTRLYTTLSPADMTADPVFSFNPSLPDLSNFHTGTLNKDCNGSGVLTTDGGFTIQYTADELNQSQFSPPATPASLRTEILSDTGAPKVVTDNSAAIQAALHMPAPTGGCATTRAARTDSSAPWLALCAAAFVALLFRRRSARLSA